MATEIEHKYLVINDEYKKLASDSHHIKQAYISRNKERTVRVRILDNSGFITIKGKNIGDTRSEYEYQIPKVDAEELIANLCEPFVLEKIRYIVSYMGNTWEVDEFKGELEGLIIAEIEIPYSEYEYGKPDFIGENVTDDPRYYNSNLSKK
ncbi:MAG: CYTH domain-containing protein [Muribaculaceae bacterium]|nr:CYTH domain-containing protein [Muribaculaceae bacterium]